MKRPGAGVEVETAASPEDCPIRSALANLAYNPCKLSTQAMTLFSRGPFGPDDDPVQRMLELLAREAEKDGTPLTPQDKEILLRERSDADPVPEKLRERTKILIARIYEDEATDDYYDDPRCFSIALQWAGDLAYPNIVALGEEVACQLGGQAYPPLKGWRLLSDRIQLIGCALLVVLSMFAIGIAGSYFFGWK